MAWAQPGVIADHVTVRELATVALRGIAVRVRISNAFGNAPLVITAASVARSAGAGAIVPSSLRTLMFRGHTAVTVKPGHTALSDPARLAVAAGETLAVSVYVAALDLVTVHPYGNGGAVSYATVNGSASAVDSASGSRFTYASEWPRIVDAVDVLERRGLGSIVVMGDSITDGFNTAVRWTDLLQRRIDELRRAQRRAVINEGITANALDPLPGDDSLTGGGPAGLRRLSSDVLAQPGVSYLVLFLGTNDIFFGASARQVIGGMRDVIRRAHAAGIKVIGVTLLPRAGSERWDPVQYPEHQPILEQVDHWIRTAHAFDGVIDMARAVADVYNGQCQPTAMFEPYDSGDHLHPDAAGQTAMANAVDTRLFGISEAPPLAAPVRAIPTSACHAG
jgi:lysophospholipase L1-like esterase